MDARREGVAMAGLESDEAAKACEELPLAILSMEIDKAMNAGCEINKMYGIRRRKEP